MSDKGSEDSHSHTEDRAQHTGSDTDISAAVAERTEAPGLEEAGGAGLQAASPSGSQCSLGQELSPRAQGTSRESSWMSLEPPGLEDQASLTARGPSPLSIDSVERQEQARAMAYQAEDGATWVSQQARREVTNRSQQTGTEWSGKALGEALISPGMEILSIGAENPVSLKLVQQKPEEPALVPHSKVVMELKMDSGNLQGLEFVLGRNEQKHMFCVGFTDTAEQKHVFSATSDHLKGSLASEMMKSSHEQTSDACKTNLETAEKAAFQCSIAALEEAGGMCNLMTLKGRMGAGKMGRMLVISEEQMGNTVIQTIHEMTQMSPASQQPQYSHDVGEN